MAMYKFYSVIHQEEGAFIVEFPDIENCFTDGDTLNEAIEMAQDALGTMLSFFEDEGIKIPAPSSAEKLKSDLPEGASLVMIEVDTDNFRKAV